MGYSCLRPLLAASSLVVAALAVSGCERADPQFKADLSRGVSTVMCAQSPQEREAGVVLLAKSIERFEPQNPYENRRIAIDRALKEFNNRGCPRNA